MSNDFIEFFIKMNKFYIKIIDYIKAFLFMFFSNAK